MAYVSSFLRNRRAETSPAFDPFDRAGSSSGRILILYGRVLPFLLAGYLLFDKAFAYIHIPGVPLYVGEIALTIGAFGSVAAIRYLVAPLMDEPIFALLTAFFFFGVIRFLPGLQVYGIKAVRDFALVYYCLFAFFIAAVMARSPDLLERLIVQLLRFMPWLLIWLPVDLIIGGLTQQSPTVPFTTISIFTYKPTDAAVAVLLALGCLWLFPDWRSARSRAAWSTIALGDLAVIASETRGGMLAAIAGAMIGLVFSPDRRRLTVRSIVVISSGLVLASLFSIGISTRARAISVPQLIANVTSITGSHESPGLSGTVNAREQLWSRILNNQLSGKKLIFGSGFGPNLVVQAGLLDSGGRGQSTIPGTPGGLRNPHNSHLDILARMGVIGLFLWVAVWLGWYWRLVSGCMRLTCRGLYVRKQIALLCLMVATAVLVSSFFNPSLEGPQAAILLWVAFGVGVVVTSFRWWFGNRDLHLDHNVFLGSRGYQAIPAHPAAKLMCSK